MCFAFLASSDCSGTASGGASDDRSDDRSNDIAVYERLVEGLDEYLDIITEDISTDPSMNKGRDQLCTWNSGAGWDGISDIIGTTYRSPWLQIGIHHL